VKVQGRRAARERQRLRCVLGPDDLPAAAAYAMAPRLLTVLTGRNLPRIRPSAEAEPSTIDDTTIADFTRVVDQDGKRCFPRDEIIADTKKAKPKKARRRLPSTHASVRDHEKSQHALGKALGVTFQKIQKYENGTNRIGAARLFDARL
jgi:hypothetical protein